MFNWYAIYVRSRHEFVSHRELLKKGIASYLPTIKKLRRWKDRQKSLEFPLFPGYLFVHIPPRPDEYLNVLKTRGVVNMLHSEPGSPATLLEEEIATLKLMLESGAELSIYPQLKEGTKVSIKKGPLKGATGLVSKQEGQYMFVVNIHILGRSVAVRTYADDLETI